MEFDWNPDGKATPETWLLARFEGEGAHKVVYAIAPPDDPGNITRVMRFWKPNPVFEMETPHYSLRLREDLYPDHPLRMSADRRLEMLTLEMAARIDDRHLFSKGQLYRDLAEKTLLVLQLSCWEAFNRDEQLEVILDSSPARGFLDDDFGEYLDELLSDGLIVHEYRPYFHKLRADIDDAIARWRSEGGYSPLAMNPYVNLLGLYAEDFIDTAELTHISQSAEFGHLVRPDHAEGLFDLITTFHAHLRGELGRKGDSAAPAGRPVAHVAAVGCDLLRQAADGRLAGLALLWAPRCSEWAMRWRSRSRDRG